jgi:hypothetical protein
MTTDSSTTPPPLSIIVACRDPWPAIQRALDALYGQAVAVGAEIIIAVSDPSAVAPEAQRLYPAATWILGKRDDSIFQLRALALARCRSEIIGMTEDHAFVTPGWCQAILDAHAQYPDAAAIGGVIENGATRTIKDCVSFFIGNGRFMHPIRNGATDDISLQANVSYKRRALTDSFAQFGLVPSILHRQLRDRGAQLVATDRMVALHAQELTFKGYTDIHFHNARTTSAFLRMAVPEAPFLIGYLLWLPNAIWRTFSVGLSKRNHRRELLLGFPLMLWLLCCHAAGELTGHFTGPGTSPGRVK